MKMPTTNTKSPGVRHLPSFFEPAKTGQLWIERADRVAEEAARYQKTYAVEPAVNDKEKVAVFGIDTQVGFMHPQGSLFVPGAVEDANRAIEFIYRNLDRITTLQFSLDTHRIFQIFHPSFWMDENGNPPAPFTAITTSDIRSGKWRAVQNPKLAFEYCAALERDGKKVLVVWPYHTLLGGASHALLPAIMEAAIFHALVRKSQTHFESKGSHTMTENYSVLEPEVKQLGQAVVGEFNTAFFELLMRYDKIYVWGEASSHCVLETVSSLQREVSSRDKSLLRKIYLLEDAMSPVPAMGGGELDFPEVARKAIAQFRDAGINVVKTTDTL